MFLSHIFLVFLPKRAVSLQPTSPLYPLFSYSHQHLAFLQPTIILALSYLYSVDDMRIDDVHETVWPKASNIHYIKLCDLSPSLLGFIDARS